MKVFAKAGSAPGPRPKISVIPSIHACDRFAVSLFLGLTALVFAFVAASAFETPGTTSTREVSAQYIATALYLAFCQFWVAPRGSRGFRVKLPTLIAGITPLLVSVIWLPLKQGVPWLAAGCLGSVVGTMLVQRATTLPQRTAPAISSIDRGHICRHLLLTGAMLFVAIAIVIPLAVIPSVMADTAHGSYARNNGIFLGVTVVFDLLCALLLGLAYRPAQQPAVCSKGTLGITAFMSLYLGLAYCGLGVLFSGYGPGLRAASILLLVCAVFGLITTTLMSIASIMVDRARLEK